MDKRTHVSEGDSHPKEAGDGPATPRPGAGVFTKRRIIGALIAVVVVTLAFPVAAIGAGTANCSEGGDATNRWQGHSLEDANQKHGVSGTAEAHTLAQCTNPALFEASGSFIWSNITPNNGGFNDIIQVGMANCRSADCVGGMRYYSSWGRTHTTPGCNGFSDLFPTPLDEGSYASVSHDFKVYHQNDAWRWFVDSTQVRGLTESSLCWTPKIAVWFGESWDFGDQIGGTAANKMSVTSMNYANAENGGFFWTNFNAANSCNFLIPAAAPFFCDVTGTRSYDTWTNR